MKKLYYAILLSFSTFVSAQSLDFGLKGGVVFNASDGFWEGMGNVSDGKGINGFQLGAVLRAKFLNIYVQPELLYSQTRNDYENAGTKYKVTNKSMDIPVGIGKQFLGLAHFQIGPTFSYYFKDKLNVKKFSNASQDDFGVSFHVGAGIQLKSLLLDLRYQRGFSKLSSKFIDGTTSFKTENRPQQINLSLTYFL